MPRYYLNLFNDVDAMDEEGSDFPDLGKARSAAMEAARELIADHVTKARPVDLGHRIEVTDEKGQVLVVVRFREVITLTDDSAAQD
ncbi:DUF6894 family protein [Sphingomonas psychrotolerans]|uniref:DUF6894 domain-containing protein n=1 Tax=Sphingomonas psychrotolerans TaxID=1327635 RepID=A0A2K8MM93_9SPHN|nr:hypothetical protein [Sphingomonas psychrotolerans]ATY34144.1 hypothetical protein CVN68_21095 [Sphingomonas psychrotolerans]